MPSPSSVQPTRSNCVDPVCADLDVEISQDVEFISSAYWKGGQHRRMHALLNPLLPAARVAHTFTLKDHELRRLAVVHPNLSRAGAVKVLEQATKADNLLDTTHGEEVELLLSREDMMLLLSYADVDRFIQTQMKASAEAYDARQHDHFLAEMHAREYTVVLAMVAMAENRHLSDDIYVSLMRQFNAEDPRGRVTHMCLIKNPSVSLPLLGALMRTYPYDVLAAPKFPVKGCFMFATDVSSADPSKWIPIFRERGILEEFLVQQGHEALVGFPDEWIAEVLTAAK